MALAAAALTLGSTGAAMAQAWRSVGPPSGAFTGLLGAPGSPNTVYTVSAEGALWSSADRGDSWIFAGEPAGRNVLPPVQLAAVEPGAPGIVYAVTPAGVEKSTDGGVSWTQIIQGLQGLVLAPSAPLILYGTRVQSGGPAQVLRSSDGGATWAVAGTLPAAFSSASLAVSATAPRTVYAEGPPGFVRSTDGGATWGAAFSVFGATDQPLGVFAGQGAVVYLAVRRPAGESGAAVYRSVDGGLTWLAADGGLARPLGSLVVAPSGNLYAGVDGANGANGGNGGNGAKDSTLVFQTANGGTSWQQLSSVATRAHVAVAAGTPDRLFLTSASDGIEVSPDQGHTWTTPSHPPSGDAVDAVLAGPAGTSSLYVQDINPELGIATIQHSPDGGLSWSTLTPTQQIPGGPLLLDAQPGVLYSYSSPPLAGPIISQDDGASWQGFSTPTNPDLATALALATDPLLPGKVVRLGCPVDFILEFSFGCDQIEIHLTNTFGRGWRFLGKVVAQVTSNGQFLVALDPANPSQAYAVVNNTLYKTVPGNTTLSLVGLAGPFVDLAVVPGGPIGAGAPPTLYAALASSRQRVLFKSTDGGNTWLPASLDLPRYAEVLQLVADPTTTPTTLYLLTRQEIFVSADAAGSWKQLSAPGLPSPFSIDSLAISSTLPKTLYVATADAGVFALTLP